MIKRIAIALVVVVLAVVLLGLVLPRTWRVEQSVLIASTPGRIGPFLFDLRRWQEWSVWTRELDPQVRNTYEGPPDGVGARWSWLGPKMGRGQLEIVTADLLTGLTLDEAIESETVNAHASIRFSPEAGGTRVTWVDQGTLPPLVGGYFRGMVVDLLDDNLSRGLQKLKGLVESLPQPALVPAPVEPRAPEVNDAGP